MLTRYNGNLVPFANGADPSKRYIFGGTTASDNIDDNINSDFLTGWEIVGQNDAPPKQWFNALGYTSTYLAGYLYQMGIPEWNTNQEYFINSRAMGSDGDIYKSLTGTSGTPNIGNDPVGDIVNWENENTKYVNLSSNQTISGIKTFNSFPVTPSIAPTTDYQVANKKYVDDNSGNVIEARPTSVYSGTDYTVTTGVSTKVQYSQVEYDDDNSFDISTNYRFQPTVSGYYDIKCSCHFVSTANITQTGLSIHKNGTIYKAGDVFFPSSTLFQRAFASCTVFLNGTTDYIEAFGACTSPSGTITVKNGSALTYFQATLQGK